MACKTVTTESGRVLAIACGPAPSGPCKFCNRRHKWLCDFETEPGTTCDAKLCDQHTLRIFGLKDSDFCPPHYAEMKEVARV